MSSLLVLRIAVIQLKVTVLRYCRGLPVRTGWMSIVILTTIHIVCSQCYQMVSDLLSLIFLAFIIRKS